MVRKWCTVFSGIKANRDMRHSNYHKKIHKVNDKILRKAFYLFIGGCVS